MMENMRLEEGKTVIVKYTQVPKGTYVKLQPHTKIFCDISNAKSMYIAVAASLINFIIVFRPIFSNFLTLPWLFVQFRGFTEELRMFNNR